MTMATSTMRPRQSGQFAKIYAGTWVVLALLALSYVVTIAVQPGLLGSWIPERAEPETNEGHRSAARFATDISGLRQSVGEIQRDLTTLRIAVATGVARDKELIERVNHLEERAKQPAIAEVSAPAAVPKTAAQRQAEIRAQRNAVRSAVPQAAAEAASTTPADPTQAAIDPANQKFVVLNGPPAASSPISTGSIPLPPAAGVPAPPPPAQTVASFGPGAVKIAVPSAPAGVELGSGPSLDALRLNWSLLADRHGAQLKSYEARYLSAGEGQPYQLLAGPIATPEEASKVCAQLRAKKVACRVTGFGGNAL